MDNGYFIPYTKISKLKYIFILRDFLVIVSDKLRKSSK